MDIVCQVNPEHTKKLLIKNGVKVLYLKLMKTLYGCMNYAILWYELRTKTLNYLGFIINLRDRCIENSVIYDKQCKIDWYFNDRKVLHIEEKVNIRIIDKTPKNFGELTVS